MRISRFDGERGKKLREATRNDELRKSNFDFHVEYVFRETNLGKIAPVSFTKQWHFHFSLCTPSTTIDLSALWMAFQCVRVSLRPCPILILCYSQGALHQPSSEDRAGLLANEDEGWQLSFQWIPVLFSYLAIKGVGALTAAAHLEDLSISIQRIHDVRHLIHADVE